MQEALEDEDEELSKPLMPIGVDHGKEIKKVPDARYLSKPLMPIGVDHETDLVSIFDYFNFLNL